MKRRYVVSLLASVLALSIVVPAFGGPSLPGLNKQVKTLKSRVDALAALNLLRNDVTTVESRGVMISRGNGFYSGTASCGILGKATGGGVTFDSTITGADSVIESGPNGANGWRATVYSPQGHSATVRVICTDLG